MTAVVVQLKTAPPATRRRSGPDRWPEIVTVAAELFAEKGYEGTSLRDVAERLGMLKGSLYHYISGKSDLLVHVLREAHERGVNALAALAQEDGPALLRLEAIVAAHARYVCTESVFTASFIEAHRHLAPDRAQEFVTAERSYRLLIEGLIARGQAEGDLRPDLDPKVAALCLLGFLNSLHGWVRPARRLSIRRICDHAIAMGIGGMRAQ
ncbi:TetR/AcrR family transcriptional regulator [Croceicoccus ponticola]|uniref:TetR/AcrR family transcriptional regulator n=1 Tax=Croceicoccus ponticola TaxID=2217664 RepID=A0A437GVN7_9SPHN|nr:TetR/AcrR family transcriptional regulator [Croceicoccus ponticola]RVQ65688.1 TetR/AcrR family transcriptional regulator [Croceicoccus ponticola]